MKTFQEFTRLDETEMSIQAHFREGHAHLRAAQSAGDEAEHHEEKDQHELAHAMHTVAAAHYAAAAHHFGRSNNDDEYGNASMGAAHHAETAETLAKKHKISLY